MALAELSADDLRRGLETLPQELYDQIYSATFSSPSGVRDLNDVAGVRQNLKLLHISTATRALYASEYYGHGAVFECPSGFSYQSNCSWLHLLPPGHRALLSEIQLPACDLMRRNTFANEVDKQCHIRIVMSTLQQFAKNDFGQTFAARFVVKTPAE